MITVLSQVFQALGGALGNTRIGMCLLMSECGATLRDRFLQWSIIAIGVHSTKGCENSWRHDINNYDQTCRCHIVIFTAKTMGA